MLTVRPVEALIVASWEATDSMDHLQRRDHLAHLTGNGYCIIGVRLGQVKHLDAFVFRLIPIRDTYLAHSEERLQVLDHAGFHRRDMGCVFQGLASLRLQSGKTKLRCRLLRFAHVARMAGQR